LNRLKRWLRWNTLAGAAIALILAAGACGDSEPTAPVDPPDMLPDGQITFLRQAGTAPPLVTYDTTFVATAGVALDVEIRYAPPPGEDSGEKFLEFQLEDESLLRYPPNHPIRPGAEFQPGDTVWIRVTIDPVLLVATFEPSGLQFSAVDPAELEIRYVEADDDYDDDGDPDPELEGDIDLWRQEAPGSDWQRVGDLKDAELDRVRALLTGFSRYGLGI
jgi:hypothetical protein